MCLFPVNPFMLIAGCADGVYGVTDIFGSNECGVEKVLEAEEVYRVRQFESVDGLFVTAESGLYYSPDGIDWTELSVPDGQVYAVTASPSGERIYAGTRPARVWCAEWSSANDIDEPGWEALSGFDEVRTRSDWGIPRHDGVAQVRSLCTHPSTPDRLVAGVEVGGMYVSEDRGRSWSERRIEGFDAPHTDDVHHVSFEDDTTLIASTGSGLYRSPDTGRTWDRLDGDHSQRYFREAFVADGSTFAGAAPASSTSWNTNTDHALFECHDGTALEAVTSPMPDEVAIGWCAIGDVVVAATHRGTLLERRSDGWYTLGITVPADRSLHRYLQLTWYDPR